jgi:aminopeptidase-like protein
MTGDALSWLFLSTNKIHQVSLGAPEGTEVQFDEFKDHLHACPNKAGAIFHKMLFYNQK